MDDNIEYLIVIRILDGFAPSVVKIIKSDSFPDRLADTDVENYFEWCMTKANNIIKDDKNRCPEFTQATYISQLLFINGDVTLL